MRRDSLVRYFALLALLHAAHAACGDGFPNPGEQCDDGNTIPGDGCSPTCLVEVCYNTDTFVPTTPVKVLPTLPSPSDRQTPGAVGYEHHGNQYLYTATYEDAVGTALYIHRIIPSTNTVDCTKRIDGVIAYDVKRLIVSDKYLGIVIYSNSPIKSDFHLLDIDTNFALICPASPTATIAKKITNSGSSPNRMLFKDAGFHPATIHTPDPTVYIVTVNTCYAGSPSANTCVWATKVSDMSPETILSNPGTTNDNLDITETLSPISDVSGRTLEVGFNTLTVSFNGFVNATALYGLVDPTGVPKSSSVAWDSAIIYTPASITIENFGQQMAYAGSKDVSATSNEVYMMAWNGFGTTVSFLLACSLFVGCTLCVCSLMNF